MFEAQLLITDSNAPEVYSPWFPRRGDNARFTLEIVAKSGSTKLTVALYTKTPDASGDGSTIGSPVDIGSVGRTEFDSDSEMAQLVRYKFLASSGSTGDWILFRLLPPVWFDSVKA